MTLVRIGERVISLGHIIEVGPGEAGPGRDRVHLTTGRTLDLCEQETHDLRAVLSALVPHRDVRHAHGVVASRRPNVGASSLDT